MTRCMRPKGKKKPKPKKKKENKNRKKKIIALEKALGDTFMLLEGAFALGPAAIKELNVQMNKFLELQAKYVALTDKEWR